MSEYAGWSSWDTWNAHLWLTNEEGTDRAARAAAKAGDINRLKNLVRDHTGAVKDGVEFGCVDWPEILAALLEGT